MKFVVAFAVVVAVCAPLPAEGDRRAVIVRESRTYNKIGNYQFEFETSNGIVREENGEQKEALNGNAPVVVRGTASWTSPEGTPIELKYFADENGYHPTV